MARNDDDGTAGIARAFCALIALVGFVAIIAWVAKQLHQP